MSDVYWEIYDDQSADDFKSLSYMSLSGEMVKSPITGDLEMMVHEIRRLNGMDTEVRLYKE